MQNQIENLFFITHEKEPIIINREDGLSVVDLQNPALSINILEIFNLNLNDLADSNTSLIRSKLNNRFEVTRETTTLTITESNPALPPNIDDNPDAPIAKVYNPCEDYWEFEMPLQYANWINSHFSSNIFSVSESDLKLYWSETLTEVDINMFKEAGLACSGNGNYCVCPSFECFLKNFAPLIDGDVFPDTKEKISKLALIYQLHLTPDEQECLNGTGLYAELADLLGNNSLSSACEPSLTPEEMINNAIDNMGECSLDGFYQALGDHEDYIIQTESFAENQKISCIWNLLAGNNNDFLCTTLDGFFSGSKYDLYLYVGNSPGRCAITRNNYPHGEISITFDQDCIDNKTIIELVKTILHESIHAELYRIVKEIGGYENLQPDNYPEIWEAYRNSQGWQHEYMADWYLEKLAKSLALFDDNVFSMDHYIALAWQGLGENPNDPNHPLSIRWTNLSEAEKQNISILRQELIENSTINCP